MWHDCNNDGDPGPLYNKLGLDWVLVQFEEPDTGFRPLPDIAEWNKETKQWNVKNDNEFDKEYYKKLKAIGWTVMEKYQKHNTNNTVLHADYMFLYQEQLSFPYQY